MKRINILISVVYFSFLLCGGSSEKVDGDYIMHHIQDDRVFEFFNPLDYQDSNYGILTKKECYEIEKKYPDKKVKWHGSYENPNEKAPCGDDYFFTAKIKLDADWNKLKNIPFINNYLSWKWDPSTSLVAMPSDNQLILNIANPLKDCS